jgi:hypothetical protein
MILLCYSSYWFIAQKANSTVQVTSLTVTTDGMWAGCKRQEKIFIGYRIFVGKPLKKSTWKTKNKTGG